AYSLLDQPPVETNNAGWESYATSVISDEDVKAPPAAKSLLFAERLTSMTRIAVGLDTDCLRQNAPPHVHVRWLLGLDDSAAARENEKYRSEWRRFLS